MAGREGKRGECQMGLGLVWRETGAVRNARPSRGQAASTRKRAKWKKDAKLPLALLARLLKARVEWRKNEREKTSAKNTEWKGV